VAFANRYRDDPVFALQVDEAVLRILRVKLRLYGGEFDPTATGLATSGAIDASGDLALRGARCPRIALSAN
jgi:hypothetical protein